MDLDSAIRERRTTKNFTDEPIEPAVVRELVELAQWAPNHNMTTPWRFRLVGPESTAALMAIAPADKKGKVVRAQTRVLVTAAAVQTLLLAATARGIDSFWQSPTIAAMAPSRFKLRLPTNEQLVAMVHLGHADGERATPPRPALDAVYSELP